MAIDYETENLITLDEAGREFKPNGVSKHTIERWAKTGIQVYPLGTIVKLDSLLVGGKRLTSREALARFIAAQNAIGEPHKKKSKPTAREILTAMNEFFRHHNPVAPHAMYDETRTFKKVVEEYLQQQPTKKARQTNLTGQ